MSKPLGAALAALLLGSCGGGGSSDTVGVVGGTEQLVSSRVPAPAKDRGAGRQLRAEPATVVNTNRLDDQTLRAVGATRDGGYAVAWLSTGDFLSMQAYDDAGAREGPEIRIPLDIPAPTAGANRLAIEQSQLAVLSDGSLVVLYTIARDAITGVYFQIFSSDGTRLVPETQVTSQEFAGPKGAFLGSPRLVALSAGGFVVSSTLLHATTGGPNTSVLSLYWFDRHGQAQGPWVDAGVFPELSYSLGADAHGGFTLVTTYTDLAIRVASGIVSTAVHFDANHASTLIAGPSAQHLSLLPLEDGYVLFTVGAEVTMQALDSQGRPVGAPRTVAAPYASFELADGSYVVISFANGAYAAQRFAVDGRTIGQPLPIDTHGGAPGAAALGEGGFVAAWTAPGPGGDADVYAQRFVERRKGREKAGMPSP